MPDVWFNLVDFDLLGDCKMEAGGSGFSVTYLVIQGKRKLVLWCFSLKGKNMSFLMFYNKNFPFLLA